MNLNKLSPRFIHEELDKVVAGQQEAKETLSIVSYGHVMRLCNAVERKHLIEPPRFTTFIVGPTGTGKTLLVSTLAEILDLPFMKIDAMHLVVPGFSGMSMLEHLEELYYRVNRKSDLFNRSIIFIDEFDKLCEASPTTHHVNHNQQIQNSILSILDGSVMTGKRNNDIDTRNMLFILGGAFENIYKKRSHASTQVGFKAEKFIEPELPYKTPLKFKELEEAGIVREILGRISVITPVYKLSKPEIKHALTEVSNSILEQFATLFYIHQKDLPLKDQDLDSIVDELYNSPYGMRNAKQILFDYFKEHMLNLEYTASESILTIADQSETNKNTNNPFMDWYQSGGSSEK